MDILIKILKEKTIIGSTTESGFICGDTPAVCFQDSPLYHLTQNIYYEQKMRQAKEYEKIRYLGIGLMFMKTYVFKKGGRPVIYEQTDVAKKILPKSEYWRIVNYDLNDYNKIIDWTHEREWRIKNNFEFELKDVTVVLPNPKDVKTFSNKYIKAFKSSPIDDLNGVIALRHLL